MPQTEPHDITQPSAFSKSVEKDLLFIEFGLKLISEIFDYISMDVNCY